MSAISTIARPYADAAFAVAAGHLDAWSAFLARGATVVGDAQVAQLLLNPRADKARLLELIADIAVGGAGESADAAVTAQQHNFLKLLAANGRIKALPAVAAKFEQLRAESEGEVDAELVTALPVGDAQQSAIAEALSRKLGRRVRIKAREDRDLIGGAIVRAGDLVIDASVRGQLAQLQSAIRAG